MQSMISGIMFTLLMRLDLIKKFFFHPVLWYRETRPRFQAGRVASLGPIRLAMYINRTEMASHLKQPQSGMGPFTEGWAMAMCERMKGGA